MDEKSLAKIRESLIDHEVSLDKDALWSAINKTERRRVVPMRLLIGIVLLSFVGLSSYKWIFSDPSIPSEKEEGLITQSYIAENKTQVTDQSKSETTAPMSKPLINTDQLEKQTKNNDQETPEKPESLVEKIITTKSNEYSSELADNKITSRTTYNSTTTFPSSNNKTSNTQTANLANQSNETSNNNRSVSQITSFGIDGLSTDEIKYASSTPEMDLSFVRPHNKSIECYDHRKKHHNWRMEFYGTVDYVDNKMTTDASNLQYLENRKSSQTQLEGYRTGIRIKYLMRNGFFVKSGLEGAWIRDRMNNETRDTFTRILANQLLETYMRNDSTFYVYGDKTQEVIRTNTSKVYNTFRSISIPLLVGYEFQLRKVFLGVELGGIYNIHHDFEGHLLDPYTNEPVEATDFFKNKINVSATGGIQLGLELTDQMRFFSMVSFKGNLNEVNNPSLNPIQQRHNSFGIGAGVEFKL